ncbi:MAG: Methyltransf21 domain-containing protein [Nitrospira sp.]|nr:MAG: Methyltransf21 domain-containing protein [Nitrospira sp.]
MSTHLIRLLVANVLPAPVLTWVKTHYYAPSVRTFWEDDVEPVKALVKEGDFVIDMGANFGWYTNVLSSLVGATGKVYSVEPIPDTFQVMSGIVRKLRLANVFPMNYAMSKTDGTAVMRVPQHEYGGSNFYRAQIDLEQRKSGKSMKEYTVPMRSLDSLFLDVAGKITFIKCDVEGHELAVVSGGAKFFEKSKPAWLMEVGGDPDEEGSPPHQLFHLMQHYGYQIYFFDGKFIRPRPVGHWSVNYLLLQPAHCRQLAHMIVSE